jgi:hypothetical protein
MSWAVWQWQVALDVLCSDMLRFLHSILQLWYFFGPMYKQNGVEVSRVPTDLVNTHENCCGKTKALHTFLLFGNHRVGVWPVQWEVLSKNIREWSIGSAAPATEGSPVPSWVVQAGCFHRHLSTALGRWSHLQPPPWDWLWQPQKRYKGNSSLF